MATDESIVAGSIDEARSVDHPSGLSGKAELVYAELERRLVYGIYRFGDTIPTASLLEEFRISRAPLTAALNRLQYAGYINIVPQVGSQVIAPSDTQVQDFFLMFSMVERGMARLAAARRSDGDAEMLQDICQRLTEVSAGRSQISATHQELVELYHRQVHESAHSPLESARVVSYRHMTSFLVRNGRPRDVGRMFRVNNELRPAVTAAIAAGSPELAERAMADYILRGVS